MRDNPRRRLSPPGWMTSSPNEAAQLSGRYLPIRQEIDLLPWANQLARRGIDLSLPVVVTPEATLQYWRCTWRGPDPGDQEYSRPCPA
jgi:5-formyltetrahydrofolate cyclo-ligase